MDSKIKSIFDTINKALDQFGGSLSSTEKAMFNEVLTLTKELKTSSTGNILSSKENYTLLNTIKGKLDSVVFNKDYLSDVSDFAKSFGSVVNAQMAYFSTLTSKKIDTAKYNTVKKMAVDNVVKMLAGAGVEANVTGQINDMLLQSITSGMSYADMTDNLRNLITKTDSGDGALTKYARTYAQTSLNQYAGQNNSLFTNDLNLNWSMYVGSNIKTTREFCEHLTAKKFIHKSELAEIISGKIGGHECKIYERTGLPYGMIEGTTPANFSTNRGGWNCGHQYVPVSDSVVPVYLRAKFDNTIIKESRAKYNAYGPAWQKALFDEETGGYNVYSNEHQFTKTKGGGDAEKHVGELLAKQGKQVEFLPENGKGKAKPDFSFDGKTWDVRSINEANVETIRKYIKDARKADNAIFYFKDEAQFKVLKDSVSRSIGYFKSKGSLMDMPDVYYIDKEGMLKEMFIK